MLLVGAENGLEVSNEECSQSRCPILVCHYASPQKKPSLFIGLGLQRASLMLLALSSPHAQNLDSVFSSSQGFSSIGA